MSTTQVRSTTRPDILTEEFLETLRQHGVVTLHLFGSVSRNEERADRDVDLLVTYDRDVSYGERFLLSEELSRLCGRRVELVTDIHPAFAPYILPTLVPVDIEMVRARVPRQWTTERFDVLARGSAPLNRHPDQREGSHREASRWDAYVRAFDVALRDEMLRCGSA